MFVWFAIASAIVAVPLLCAPCACCAADSKPPAASGASANPPKQAPYQWPPALEAASTKLLESSKQRFRGGFLFRREGPLVFVSDADPKKFNAAVDRLLQCAECMWNQFFDRRRVHYPVLCFLCKDADSYRRNCVTYFGGPRGVPAFYNPRMKTLVANLADDKTMPDHGAVVHELNHALMWQELNPPVEWIREGLAAVCEHYTIKDGKLIGLHGYRLARLRRGIAEGNIRPFRQLISMGFGEFVSGKPGLHYAQARFLMLYLQHRGLLSEFYWGYRDNVQSDRTGQKLLEKLLGKPIDEIQKDVLKWTEGLKDERLTATQGPELDN